MPAAQDAPVLVDTQLGREVVLIPVKAFQQAKRRLGSVMADPEREQLVRAMATHVVSACAPLPVAVVCDDGEVARWAADLGAAVMWEPGQGLNGAVRAGVDRLGHAGAQWVTVAHGDALLAPSVTRRLIAEFAGRPAAVGLRPLPDLSARETEVLVHVARGESNREISEHLFLGEATVKTHVGSILMKLQCRDRVQAVVMAYEAGLVRPGLGPERLGY